MATEFPEGVDTFQALVPGEDGSRRDVPVGGRTNTGYLNDLGDAVEAIESYLLAYGPAGEAAISAIREGDVGYGQRKLYGWRKAITDGRANAVVVADSNGEGSNDLDTMSQRWLNLTVAELRERHPIPDGDQSPDGYVPVFYVGDDVPGPSMTMTGNWTENIAVGFGKRAARLRADTGSGVGMASYTFVGTHFQIQWVGVNDMGKSEYRIDGGSWVELDHDNGEAFLHGYLTDPIDCGGRDEHTVEVRYKSSGAAAGANADPHIGGVRCIDADDPDRGIVLWDCAHAGILVSQLNTFGYQVGDWVEATDADLLIFTPWINEWQQSTPDTIDADVAAYKAAVVTLIGNARTDRPELEVLFRGGWTPLDSAGESIPEHAARFIAAQYEIAADDPLVSVLDCAAVLPAPEWSGDDGTWWDTFAIHMRASGHAAYASQLADALALPTSGAFVDGHEVLSTNLRRVVTITQTDYDLLTPDDLTLYVIVDEGS